jgi:hypothetical protein
MRRCRLLMTRLLCMPAAALRAAPRMAAPHSLSLPLCRTQAAARCQHIWASAAGSGGASSRSAAAEGGVAPARRGLRVLSDRVKKTVAFHQEYLCAGCGCLLPPSFEVDHIIPVALGGHNGQANLQALCRPCHAQKTRDQRHGILDDQKRRTRRPAPRPPAAPAGGEGEAAGAAERVLVGEGAANNTSGGATIAERGAAGSTLGLDGERPQGGATRPARATRAAGLAIPAGARAGIGAAVGGSGAAPLLAGMNAQQLSAATCSGGHVRLAAGPGTGECIRTPPPRHLHWSDIAPLPALRPVRGQFTHPASHGAGAWLASSGTIVDSVCQQQTPCTGNSSDGRSTVLLPL